MAKLKITKNGPVETGDIIRTSTSLDDTADIRDALSFLAGKGYSSLSDDESRKTFGRLVGLVGRPKAEKLATQVFLFNQRPETKTYSPEQKVSSFYEIGSSDKDISPYIQKAKSFGSGVLPGFRESPSLGNMILTGRMPEVAKIEKSPNEIIASKVQLKRRK